MAHHAARPSGHLWVDHYRIGLQRVDELYRERHFIMPHSINSISTGSWPFSFQITITGSLWHGIEKVTKRTKGLKPYRSEIIGPVSNSKMLECKNQQIATQMLLKLDISSWAQKLYHLHYFRREQTRRRQIGYSKGEDSVTPCSSRNIFWGFLVLKRAIKWLGYFIQIYFNT